MNGKGQTPGFSAARGGIIALALLTLLLNGCGSFKPWPVSSLLPPTRLDAISIQSTANSNDTAVVLLDIVYDYGAADAAGARVPDKAQEWYANKPALRFALRNSTAISSFEVPPGRMLPPVVFPDGYRQARRVMLFANFRGSGRFFEIDITKLKRIRIDLLENNMDVVSL